MVPIRFSVRSSGISVALACATVLLPAACSDVAHPGKDLPDGATPTPTGGRPTDPPPLHAPLTSQSKVDMLFLIDDSYSMAPLQAKLRQRMPNFMNVLKNAPGGMPDLHVAVLSSSLGAGVFGNITGCTPGTAGSLEGAFQHRATCGLNAGEAFLKTSGGANPVNNFEGDIADVFSCVADLGQVGCGFEHQLAATRLGLQRSLAPGDENYGFLRPDALLSVVMLTNEDDCSVSADSMLFDPNQQTVGDPLGGLNSYRCNEFGHRCDQTMPHEAPGAPVTMTGCESNEDGKLEKVGDFIDFLYGLKPGKPENVFIAVIAGPTTPYVIGSKQMPLASGATELQPSVAHSCTVGAGIAEYADPAIRLSEVVGAFAPNSAFTSICADDFTTTMTGIAQLMVGE